MMLEVFPVSRPLRRLEGDPEPFEFPFDELFRPLLFLLVPSGDPASSVDPERPLEGESLRSDEGEIPVRKEIVLEKFQPSVKTRVQALRFLRVPEHVVIAAQKDLLPRQGRDVVEVRRAFFGVLSPAVIPDQHEGVVFADRSEAVFVYSGK